MEKLGSKEHSPNRGRAAKALAALLISAGAISYSLDHYVFADNGTNLPTLSGNILKGTGTELVCCLDR